MEEFPGEKNGCKIPDISLATSRNGMYLEIFENQEMTDNFKSKICIPYLKYLYEELLKNSDQKNKGIDKNSFMNYFGISGLLGEKFFRLFDISNLGYVQPIVFIGNMLKIYSRNFNVRLKFIFDILDSG